MPIEFACSGCSQLLHVPDNAAGKQAKCPKCSQILRIPTSADEPTQNWDSVEPSHGDGLSPESPTTTGDAVVNPFSSPTAELHEPRQPVTSGQIQNQAVDASSVISYAWEIWKTNLGLLVGVFVVVVVISYGLGFLINVTEAILKDAATQEMAVVVVIVGNLANSAIGIFLGIGQAQIALNLARRQPAEFSNLFGSGPRFLPVLVASILFGIALAVGITLCVIPGILLTLFYWPFYYLVVDNRARVRESFSIAYTIAKSNVGTSFLLWLASIGIVIMGLMALCIGTFLAAPLVNMIWAVAYLMMSGQLPTRPFNQA